MATEQDSTVGAVEAGALIRRYREQLGLGQTAVAHELTERLPGVTVRQGQVSNHEKGKNWSFDPGPLARAYVELLGIPEQEMVEAWGFTSPSKPGPRPTTLADVIKADTTLSAASKRHLLQQYGLLQAATRDERKSTPERPKSSPRRGGTKATG